MLTQAIVKAAPAQARAYKMFDAQGLFLFISPSGCKSWRLKYRLDGKEKLLVLGRFPAMGLNEARARMSAARGVISKGLDPARAEVPDTFEALARAWHQHQAGRWSASHAADVLASLERDIFPAIGQRDPRAISSAELLATLRPIEGRGCVASAQRIRQRLSAIFGFGMSLDLCSADPAAVIGRAMAAGGLVTPHAALTDLSDCRALLTATDHLVAGNRMVRLAHRFLALTAVRLDAVRGMRWSEVEGLDGPEPIWRVPAERMKLARAKKGEARFAHLVPLSAPAVALLKSIDAELHSPDALCFPGRAPTRPIGENAIRDLIIRAGFGGRHVPHGWRASFSTILNEDLGEGQRAAIDRALAHVPKDKVEAAYNRAEQLGRRRALFDRWGELLTSDTH